MSDASDVLDRLLEAHVAHELERLQPSRLPELIDREVNAAVSLADFRDQVNDALG